MTGMSGKLAEAYATWLSTVSQCCAPLSGCLDDKPSRSFSEKRSMAVLRDQPSPTPPPYYHDGLGLEPRRPATGSSEKERVPKKSFASTRTSFSVRRRFRSSSTNSRRPQISAPSNFRHVHSESFHFPQYTHMQTIPRPAPHAPASFRPIELSIYLPDKELSPILPHFDFSNILVPPPPPAARLAEHHRVDDFHLGHDRNYASSMSFHVPRKPTGSPETSHDETPPRIPPKARARARAYTSPNVEQMKERIASAMIEVERLQQEIDSVIERQSIYAASSRPSTSNSMAYNDMEPMPSIPALPPAAPSFAERLSPGVDRPSTAPTMPLRIPHRSTTFAEASAAFITPPPSRESQEHVLPPPLPLVLRPPLRKKKSFSRVSSWLFTGGQQPHQRDISLDSITNLPRPVKGREGFYQCVEPVGGQASGRRSFDSDMTVTTWMTEDEQTMPTTTWSPGSTPMTKQEQAPPLERVATFGKDKTGERPALRKQSFGMAI